MIHCPNCRQENPVKFRLCGHCGKPLAVSAAPREVRKTVTLVFSDLQGSTALGERIDPEALHEIKERYFTAMAAQIEHHGGKIEKYIGDAIMAVFGLPRAREDDALRAVRAAAGMGAALQELNQDLGRRYGVALSNRTGVNTGIVVANDDPGADQQLATGDAVNLAARLEQAAPENAILLGETTYRLVRDAVQVQAVAPLAVKGKARPVLAMRLVSVHGMDGNVRRQDTPIVGRDQELAALAQVYREVLAGPAVRLVTLIGDAGVGKSRLAHEALARIGPGRHVLFGRCPAYGEGLTLWPLVEMIRDSVEAGHGGPAEATWARMLALVGDANVCDRLASLIGLGAAVFPLHEHYWAARKFFERLALQGPLVVLVDDIHWAAPAFLDLLEHVLDTATAAPILLLATARHELLEQRPQWAQQSAATRLVLTPLSDTASAQVASNLLGSAGLSGESVERIVRAAEGNPLYVEQMLSMLIDTEALRLEDGHWLLAHAQRGIEVPPTIQALLEARLDQLGSDERAVVESASVIGLEFTAPALASLVPATVCPAIPQHLATLGRKRFIRPDVPCAGGAVFRFHHHLVRETVYGTLLKRTRASLHVRFVRWADASAPGHDRASELDAILGHHLEQAHRYLSELGPLDEEGIALGVDAALRLAGAARQASSGGDAHAAAGLYRRAMTLLDTSRVERLALSLGLGEALAELGEYAEARDVLDDAQAAAARVSDVGALAQARVARMSVQLHSGEPGDWGAQALRTAEASIAALESLHRHDALARAWRLVALVHGVAGRYGPAGTATVRYMDHARKAGDQALTAGAAVGLAMNALFGPTPVSEAIAQCEDLLAQGLGRRRAEGIVLCALALLRAMNGEFEAARDLYRRGRAMLRDLGQGVTAASTGIEMARVELLAGGLVTTERELREDHAFLQACGETYFRSTLAALLARIVLARGGDDEALALTVAAQGIAAPDDFDAQALWRSVRAPILARAGDLVQAEALARAALEYAGRTEGLILRADTHAALAAVLDLAGRGDEALAAMAEATALYAGKGDRVSGARSAAWAGQLRSAG